jgi:hypothetical protein
VLTGLCFQLRDYVQVALSSLEHVTDGHVSGTQATWMSGLAARGALRCSEGRRGQVGTIMNGAGINDWGRAGHECGPGGRLARKWRRSIKVVAGSVLIVPLTRDDDVRGPNKRKVLSYPSNRLYALNFPH